MSSKALWIEEQLAPIMNGKVYQHIWMTWAFDQYVVSMDYYMVEAGIVYMVNNGIKQRSHDSLEDTNGQCICIGEYDPNTKYERKVLYYSKEEIEERLFTVKR